MELAGKGEAECLWLQNYTSLLKRLGFKAAFQPLIYIKKPSHISRLSCCTYWHIYMGKFCVVYPSTVSVVLKFLSICIQLTLLTHPLTSPWYENYPPMPCALPWGEEWVELSAGSMEDPEPAPKGQDVCNYFCNVSSIHVYWGRQDWERKEEEVWDAMLWLHSCAWWQCLCQCKYHLGWEGASDCCYTGEYRGPFRRHLKGIIYPNWLA